MGYPSSRHHPAASGARRPEQGSLRLQEPPERLAALRYEHDRLLKKIRQKKRDLNRLGERIEETTRRLAAAQPLAEESAQLDGEIHALFTELLSRKRQPRKARHLVATLYQALQEVGVLSSRDQWDEAEDELPDFWGPDAGPFEAGSTRQAQSPPSGAGGFSARRPGAESANQSLRTLFRDLATALHPDKVQDEDEKARRTEAMKEISGAYKDGDLARLLDLKRLWLAGGVAPASGDEIDRQRANLERTNTALRVQLKDLTQALKDLRRSPPGQMLRDILDAAQGRGEDPIAALIARANADLERARAVRDFVVSFRDGKITIDEFVRGPHAMRKEHLRDDDRDTDEETFDAFLEAIFGPSVEVSSRPRGSGRRPSKRGVRSVDERA